MNRPIIMTATMGKDDFAWANGLRRAHFPPERNHLPAHITLFHHLPPSSHDEIVALVKTVVRDHGPPRASLLELMLLGRGVAYRIDSPDLLAMRDDITERFAGLLTPQDQQRPKLHITVQNKVEPAAAKALYSRLSGHFEPRPLAIKGLALWFYMDGPWKPIGDWSFRGTVRPC